MKMAFLKCKNQVYKFLKKKKLKISLLLYITTTCMHRYINTIKQQ